MSSGTTNTLLSGNAKVKDTVLNDDDLTEEQESFLSTTLPNPLTFDRAYLPTLPPRPYSVDMAMTNKALQSFPPRPYADLLVKSFLEGANFHYYIIHPPSFLDQYQRWWADRALRRRLDPALTCLILMVCSCSLQYLDRTVQQRLDLELGSSAQELSEKYHRVSQDLSQSIPPGNGGFCQVQHLLLATYWLKSTARSVDSWHVLGAAIRMAQELEMRDTAGGTYLTEFEKELRRRTWCILYTWDWQMSTLLSRPRSIITDGSGFDLPQLHLDYSSRGINPPSPIVPMVLHCKLIQSLSKKLDIDNGPLSPSDTIIYRDEIQAWMESFPPPFRIRQPDTQFDTTHKHVPLQRIQLHATTYAMMLHPLKYYLSKPLGVSASSTEKDLYMAGIDTSISLMKALQDFFDILFPLYANFHSISCGIFDTAATLCLAIVHDDGLSHLPWREAVISSIKNAMVILQKINSVTGSKSVAHSVLRSLVSKLPLSLSERIALGCTHRKRPKLDNSCRTAITPDSGKNGRNDLPDIESQEMSRMGHIPGLYLPQQNVTSPPSLLLRVNQIFDDELFLGDDLNLLNDLVDWETIN